MKVIKTTILSLFIISSAILLTIYSSLLFYPLEISLLKLTDQVIISKTELLINYHNLLNYLTNPFVKQLNMPDFKSSASGLKHFSDVKHLFHFVQMIWLLTLYPTVRWFKYLKKHKQCFLYETYFKWSLLVPVLLALFAFFIGFDTFFVLFHKLVFVGDSSWLFNPISDPIITVLPEAFFMHCFVLFFLTYEITYLCLWLHSRKSIKN